MSNKLFPRIFIVGCIDKFKMNVITHKTLHKTSIDNCSNDLDYTSQYWEKLSNLDYWNIEFQNSDIRFTWLSYQISHKHRSIHTTKQEKSQ